MKTKRKRKTKPAPAQQPLVGVPWQTYERLLKRNTALEGGVMAAYMIFNENKIAVRYPHGRAAEKYLEKLIEGADIKIASEVFDLYPPKLHGPVEQTTDDLPEGVPQAPSGATKNNFKRRQ